MAWFRGLCEKHGYVFAALCIAVSTLVFIPGRDYFAKGQWALMYLPIIVLVAGMSGVRPALLASLLAFLAWDFFFLPPYHTLIVSDPKDWISLVVFLIIAVVMGLQTGRMKDRESMALAREREATLLNRFSSHLVSQTTLAGMAEMLLQEVCGATGAENAALYLRKENGELFRAATHRVGGDGIETSSALGIAEWAGRESKAVGLPSTRRMGKETESWPVSIDAETLGHADERGIFLPLHTEESMEGVLYVGPRRDGHSFSVHDARLLISIANQATAYLERRRLTGIASQAEALKESDRLKSAFVRSVSHELKTPLASVTATVTGLLEDDANWDHEAVREELSAISQDLDRLNDSIGSLLDLSRLEADAWVAQKDWYELGEILGTTVSRISAKQRHRIEFALPEDLPPIYVDFAQLSRALENLLENALAYSPESESVYVGAADSRDGVRIWVEDHGEGIPDDEKARIFEKFYRGKSAEKVPSGTGLGLVIAKEIVRYQGGTISVTDAKPHGARFTIFIPKERQENR